MSKPLRMVAWWWGGHRIIDHFDELEADGPSLPGTNRRLGYGPQPTWQHWTGLRVSPDPAVPGLTGGRLQTEVSSFKFQVIRPVCGRGCRARLTRTLAQARSCHDDIHLLHQQIDSL